MPWAQGLAVCRAPGDPVAVGQLMTDQPVNRSGRPAADGPARGDLVAAASFALVGALMALVAADAQGVAVPLLPACLAAVEAVPLVWRRRAPLVVLAATMAVFIAAVAVTTVAATPMLGPLAAAYTVGTRCRRRTAATAALVAAVGAPLATLGALGTPFPLTVSVTATPGHLLDAVLGSTLGFAGSSLLGAYVGTRRAYVAELAARAERLEHEREEQAERAVAEERARIARELHDVAAHHLSGIALQAAALRRTLDDDVDEARGLAQDIRDESSSALTAMRRLVTLLRSEDAEGRAPQPTLDDLDRLVDRARSEDIDVELDIDRDQLDASVPREVSMAAYRIAQESLTNVRRHAPGAHATVHLCRSGPWMRLEVTDDGGVSTEPPEAGDGHGLPGMRERVRLLGGRCEAGPREDAPGWRVHALLPVEAEGER